MRRTCFLEPRIHLFKLMPSRGPEKYWEPCIHLFKLIQGDPTPCWIPFNSMMLPNSSHEGDPVLKGTCLNRRSIPSLEPEPHDSRPGRAGAPLATAGPQGVEKLVGWWLFFFRGPLFKGKKEAKPSSGDPVFFGDTAMWV